MAKVGRPRKTGFEKFGIERISPSSASMFSQCPSFWIAKYLLKVKDVGNPSLNRGRAVEDGYGEYLVTRDRQKALDRMYLTWNLEYQGDVTGDIGREMQGLEGFLEQAIELAELLDIPAPEKTQERVEVYLDEFRIPLVGYIDFSYPNIIDDLKTTTRLPRNSPRRDHARQVSFYAKAKGVERARLLYVGPRATDRYKGYEKYSLRASEIQSNWEDMLRLINAMEKTLDVAGDNETLMAMTIPDLGARYWSEPTIKEAKEKAGSWIK